MAYETRKAQERDNAQVESDAPPSGVSEDEDEEVEVGQEGRQVAEKWSLILRKKFFGYMIHRSLRSLDNTGEPISNLAPYHEHLLKLPPYPSELANLKTLETASEADEDGASTTQVKGSLKRVCLRCCSGGLKAERLNRLKEILRQTSERTHSPFLQ